MSDEQVKVLYIGSYGRSGSTLLSRMLAQVEGYVSVGELCYIWDRGFVDNQLCGCGKSFKDCEFWCAVVGEAFGGFEKVNVHEMIALRQDVQSNRSIPALIYPGLRTAHYQAELSTYTLACEKLYLAIQKVSGSRMIIDSSKLPRYARVLKEIPNIDLHILHLIRDSRATAYSWKRKKVRPEIHWTTQYMDRQNLIRSAVEWNLTNGFLESLKYNGSKHVTLRYEDLVAEPDKTMRQIADFLNEPWPNGALLGDEPAVYLKVDHTLSGNPNRFQKGVVNIRADNEWQVKMPRGQKYAITTFTWPLLLLYRYIGYKEV